MRHTTFSLRFALLLVIGTMLLAACGGSEPAPAPTDMPFIPPTDLPDPTTEPTINSPFPTFTPLATQISVGVEPTTESEQIGPILGGVGTLVAPGTPDPDLPAGFDKIVLVRTGGPLNDQGQSIDEVIVINRDGTMTRNGAPGTTTAEGVQKVATVLDAINFFAIQSNYVGPIPGSGPQPYLYQLVVTKGFSERMITAQDGLIPAQVEAIIAAVLAEGFKIERP